MQHCTLHRELVEICIQYRLDALWIGLMVGAIGGDRDGGHRDGEEGGEAGLELRRNGGR